MASIAWKEVTDKSIANCFRKAGFAKESEQEPEAPEETVDS